MVLSPSLASLLDRALAARVELLSADARRKGALRLFHGFREGEPRLSVDAFGRTVVLYDHGRDEAGAVDLEAAALHLRLALPWVRAVLAKRRWSSAREAQCGVVLAGDARELDDVVTEGGARYALALTMNRDASLYLDTRLLRGYLQATQAAKRVLNTFAYTASLGVAARAAPASRVINLDRTRSFLEVGMRSYALNGFAAKKADFWPRDFFEATSELKRKGELFDCVIVDPPIFSGSDRGRVDFVGDAERVIDKARPLVGDGGRLVVVNNGVFVSGADFEGVLGRICESGYWAIEARIPAPADFTVGDVGALPVDPSPYNHSTKIAVLQARRKDGRRASEAGVTGDSLA